MTTKKNTAGKVKRKAAPPDDDAPRDAAELLTTAERQAVEAAIYSLSPHRALALRALRNCFAVLRGEAANADTLEELAAVLRGKPPRLSGEAGRYRWLGVTLARQVQRLAGLPTISRSALAQTAHALCRGAGAPATVADAVRFERVVTAIEKLVPGSDRYDGRCGLGRAVLEICAALGWVEQAIVDDVAMRGDEVKRLKRELSRAGIRLTRE